MNTTNTPLEILTLGRFSIFLDGKPVAANWPDETSKTVFCSLLSPLDLSFTLERICRSLWDAPVTQTSKLRLEDDFIHPLNCFLIKELGFNPLISGHDSIRIDPQGIHIDAFEYHSAVVEGLRLMSLGNHAVAREKLNRAKLLYAGNYLPGMPGKIIHNTRNELESLYRTAVTNFDRAI
jgi:hypothetical protein